MAQQPIRFDDGAAYERLMGTWSRLVAPVFLSWLAPERGQRWLDVGCGNGAFTEMLMHLAAPSAVEGIDPSTEQIAFARARPGARGAVFQQGDAMALPFPPASFDIAVMALVIHFVPRPAQGVAEMTRVVRPGGTVAAYVWDQFGGGSPTEPFNVELAAMGHSPAIAPSSAATPQAALRELWTGAGLEAVATHRISVERTFADFEDFWTVTTGTGSVRASLAGMGADAIAELRARIARRLPVDAAGQLTYAAHVNAVKGLVPAAG